MATQPCLNKVILKEFKDTCYRSFAQDQITITFPDEEDLTKVEVILTPNEGVYRDARIVFSIDLTTDYPTRAPVIRCKTPVLHPNIEGDEICLNILDDEWSECLRLVDYAHALLWLLYNPNLDSRLNCDCPEEEASFLVLARRALCGEHIGGRLYECLLIVPEAPPPPPAPTVVGLTTTFSLAASLAARFGLEHPNATTDDKELGDASPAALCNTNTNTNTNTSTNEQQKVEAPTLTPIAV